MSEILDLKAEIRALDECVKKARKRLDAVGNKKTPTAIELENAHAELALRLRQMSTAQSKLRKLIGIKST